MAGSNFVVDELFKLETVANTSGEMLKFIRLNQNAPNLTLQLDHLQPIEPFYWETNQPDPQTQLTVSDMLEIDVSAKLFKSTCVKNPVKVYF